ncbi:MAG TPA: hypothetical protein VMI33_03635 [Streptosporangiaceae bacterium]|nr:hypothetical protein [Streptosporangiaceae bacterium]
MPQVKVRRQGITAEEAAAVIRSSLPGDNLQITDNGERELELTKSFLVRANVSIASEPGGTVFNVRGGGPVIPLLFVTTRVLNNRGIARRVAAALGEHEGFRDDA